MLPRGVDEYLERRLPAPVEAPAPQAEASRASAETAAGGTSKAKPGSADERAAKKVIARIDKQLERIGEQQQKLELAMAEAVNDYTRLAELSAELDQLAAEKDDLELEWLEAAEALS
jgi:ATP-binding cassette subfamily F protein uup